MGLVHVEVKLSNPLLPNQPPLTAQALVDTGASYLCLPQWMADRLGLRAGSTKTVELADGELQQLRYVGPVYLRIGDHECHSGALVVGDEVLLGAVPLEEMNLVVYPLKQQLLHAAALRAG